MCFLFYFKIWDPSCIDHHQSSSIIINHHWPLAIIDHYWSSSIINDRHRSSLIIGMNELGAGCEFTQALAGWTIIFLKQLCNQLIQSFRWIFLIRSSLKMSVWHRRRRRERSRVKAAWARYAGIRSAFTASGLRINLTISTLVWQDAGVKCHCRRSARLPHDGLNTTTTYQNASPIWIGMQ